MANEQREQVGVNDGTIIPAVERVRIGKAIAILEHLPGVGGVIELVVLDFPVVDMAGRSRYVGDSHDGNGSQGDEQSQEVNFFGYAFEEKQLNPPLGYRVQGQKQSMVHGR